MEAAQPRSIELSRVTNPVDTLLPEAEAGDRKQRENHGSDHGVSDGSAPMNAPARPQVIRDDKQWKAMENGEEGLASPSHRPFVRTFMTGECAAGPSQRRNPPSKYTTTRIISTVPTIPRPPPVPHLE